MNNRKEICLMPIYGRVNHKNGIIVNYATIDVEDFDKVNAIGHWNTHTAGYPMHCDQKTGVTILMHRLILDFPELDIDHEDHCPMNNQKYNLRLCTTVQNGQNRLKNRTHNGLPTSSIFKGVYFHQATSKWIANIKLKGMYIRIGQFLSEIDAAHAYNKCAKKLFGEFCLLNNI